MMSRKASNSSEGLETVSIAGASGRTIDKKEQFKQCLGGNGEKDLYHSAGIFSV
jgi:hypothetical protein